MASLCLGTAQFGMEYGVNNTLGQPAEEDSFRMLDTAVAGGIYMIDTARAYGNAEQVLGRYFISRKNQAKVKVVSKLRPNAFAGKEKRAGDIVKEECRESLKRLCLEQLDGYLLHNPEDIKNPDVVDALKRLKEEGLVKNVGVSIYEISDGEDALRTNVVDYIQMPYNVLDQRGIKEGFISKAKKLGVTIFTRSAFLQGLFFMERERIPSYLQNAIPYLDIFDGLLRKYQVDRKDALLQFVIKEEQIDYLVFGVDTEEQLKGYIDNWHNDTVPPEFIEEVKNSFGAIDKSIIFPSLWGK